MSVWPFFNYGARKILRPDISYGSEKKDPNPVYLVGPISTSTHVWGHYSVKIHIGGPGPLGGKASMGHMHVRKRLKGEVKKSLMGK